MNPAITIRRACVLLLCLLPATGFATALRYDGFYRLLEPSTNTSIYLRFYPDGTALSAASADTAEKTFEWFHRDSKAGSRGHFTVRGNQLRFTTFGFESRTDCTGTIENASLILKCGGSDITSRFEFLPMRPAQ
jgi:hypothetical protein